ncbi:MAG TPA: DUF3501 family protein [Candidatus Binataceae bacterium]|nr:DUF3501 family protein [Candidatus Binataceae bacterium]
MIAVQPTQLLSPGQYETLRPLLRPLFIAEKERRRLELGAHLTLLFENTQTVWYQIQEMIRSEKIVAFDALAHELETYNELLPDPHQLSATLLIQFPDPAQRDEQLHRLVGLERHLWLIDGERRELARFDTRQMTEERISSVHFVKFSLGDYNAEQFLERARHGRLAIEVDHPHLSARAPVNGTLAVALASDLEQY